VKKLEDEKKAVEEKKQAEEKAKADQLKKEEEELKLLKEKELLLKLEQEKNSSFIFYGLCLSAVVASGGFLWHFFNSNNKR